ncbi:MAG TPA: hydrogenase/urease maturation nickel metallochaperone HypA [Gemmatimonadaceae bacterium]|jgi:Zn finger protein HypA/HybF involved in hydrogenase expression
MHEMSVAMEICQITERAIGARSPSAVTEVVIDVGDDAGVEIQSLEFCLEALFHSPPFSAARAVVRREGGDVLRVASVEVEE